MAKDAPRKPRSTEPPIRAVLDSPEQTTKVLQPDSEAAAALTAAEQWIECNRQRLGMLYYVLVLMSRHGCRVSEALGVQAQDVDSKGGIWLRAKKGSNSRYILDGELAAFFIRYHKQAGNIFVGYNRIGVWRILKGAGIGVLIEGKGKESVTHMFRHLYVDRLRETEQDPETLKQATGHKNPKNLTHYGTKKKRERGNGSGDSSGDKRD